MDTLYAEMAYPESFERSRDWALFEDLLGIEDNEPDSDIDEAQYFTEVTQDDDITWMAIRPTTGLRVVIELEKGIRWGPEPKTFPVEADAGPSNGPGGEFANGLTTQLAASSSRMGKEIDLDDSVVEDLLPTEH